MKHKIFHITSRNANYQTFYTVFCVRTFAHSLACIPLLLSLCVIILCLFFFYLDFSFIVDNFNEIQLMITVADFDTHDSIVEAHDIPMNKTKYEKQRKKQREKNRNTTDSRIC